MAVAEIFVPAALTVTVTVAAAGCGMPLHPRTRPIALRSSEHIVGWLVTVMVSHMRRGLSR